VARPRAADHEQHRASIRENAVQAFARLGYASASMADLATACGISKATLYHYFDSKDALLFECLNDYTQRLDQLTATYTNTVNTADANGSQAQLRALITALLREYAISHNYHVSLLHDVKFLGAEQARQIRSQERAVVGKIADLIDASFPGRVPVAERIPTTMALLGMINFTFAWLRPDGPMSYEAFAQIAIDLWFNGLGQSSATNEPVVEPLP
jgi:AcrR family transcriptional regulator